MVLEKQVPSYVRLPNLFIKINKFTYLEKNKYEIQLVLFIN